MYADSTQGWSPMSGVTIELREARKPESSANLRFKQNSFIVIHWNSFVYKKPWIHDNKQLEQILYNELNKKFTWCVTLFIFSQVFVPYVMEMSCLLHLKVPGLAFLRFYCTYIRGNLTSCDAIGSSLKKDLPENLTDALFTKISFQESKLHFNDFHSWKSIQTLNSQGSLKLACVSASTIAIPNTVHACSVTSVMEIGYISKKCVLYLSQIFWTLGISSGSIFLQSSHQRA